MNIRNLIVAVAAIAAVTSGADAQEANQLATDFSRAYLANYGASFESGWRSLPYPFNFPTDARATSIFGIDVSHYEGQIDWTAIPDQKVAFVYIKATQGSGGTDPTFSRNWAEVAKLQHDRPNLFRGAYHFMSARDDAQSQAENFSAKVGALGAKDLPATLDLEWDFKSQNGKPVLDDHHQPVDQWADVNPAEIVKRVKLWSDIVEHQTGKRPIFYTNFYWWKDRIGSTHDLDDYKLWIADYASKSLGAENPKSPNNRTWLFWQFTDFGRLAQGGIAGHVDTSIFQGSPDDFAKFFSVTLTAQ